MPRRRKKPSKYRFVRPLGLTFMAIVIGIAMFVVRGVPCVLLHTSAPSSECVRAPTAWQLTAILWILGIAGVVGASYRYYMDFYKGEYYEDGGV